MPEETQTATAPPENGGAAPVSDLAILNGGIEIEAQKIDGSIEKVRVRQLPIALLGDWGNSQADEAYLVELLCDRIDRTTQHHLRNTRMMEMRILEILHQAPIAQIEEIERRLFAVREEIAKHEAKSRWSDELTHDTAAKIRELGEQLNKKKFSDQTKRRAKAAQAILETMGPSSSPTSSAASPPSGGQPSAT